MLHRRSNLSLLAIFAVTMVVLVASLRWGRADNGTAPATQPAAEPTMTAIAPEPPATRPVLSPETKALLDQVKTAYAALQSLSITGKETAHFDVDGHKEDHSFAFTVAYHAPDKFRYERKGEDGNVLLGSTGEKTYAFDAINNQYMSKDAPKKFRLADLDPMIAAALQHECLSLALVLSNDVPGTITDGIDAITAGVVKTAAQEFPTLTVSTRGSDVVLAFDPVTHLLHSQTTDMSRYVKASGGQKVDAAQIRWDYENKPGDTLDDKQFAWTPPAGAHEVHPPEDPAEMVGKPAPVFSLTGLDGKVVSSADLKGKIYVLDFWATWCVYCRDSLPHLDALYQANKAAGLKVFAVDELGLMQETKEKAQQFVTDTKLGIPVLLDTDSKLGGDAYHADNLPQTVVVGKDGNIIQVFVGGEQDEAIAKTVADAMAKK